MNQSQYARHRKAAGLAGQTRQAVAKRIKAGDLDSAIVAHDAKGKPQLDAALADKAWAANTTRPPDSAPGSVKVADPAKAENPQEAEAASGQLTLNEARTRQAAASANKATAEYKLMAGKLLPKKSVLRACFDAMRQVRYRLQGMGQKLAMQLANATTPAEVRRILEAEIASILNDLARAFRDLPSNIGGAGTGD